MKRAGPRSKSRARRAHPAAAQAVRTGLLAAVTLVVGCLTYSQVKASVAAPPNLRSIHPAPPSQITFRARRSRWWASRIRCAARGGATWRTPRRGASGLLSELRACHGDHLDGRALRGGPESVAGQLPGQRHDRPAHRELCLLASRQRRARIAARGDAVEFGHAGVGKSS